MVALPWAVRWWPPPPHSPPGALPRANPPPRRHAPQKERAPQHNRVVTPSYPVPPSLTSGRQNLLLLVYYFLITQPAISLAATQIPGSLHLGIMLQRGSSAPPTPDFPPGSFLSGTRCGAASRSGLPRKLQPLNVTLRRELHTLVPRPFRNCVVDV